MANHTYSAFLTILASQNHKINSRRQLASVLKYKQQQQQQTNVHW